MIFELRREHPRWGEKRIRLELLRKPPAWHAEKALTGAEVPSTSTINRILRRQGLVLAQPRAACLAFAPALARYGCPKRFFT